MFDSFVQLLCIPSIVQHYQNEPDTSIYLADYLSRKSAEPQGLKLGQNERKHNILHFMKTFQNFSIVSKVTVIKGG